ncbi:C-C chemokine receptor type 3-like [Seriola dumerili]|uniref:C-C chemokine receptor type 3-like n=1 Tax=Seriola dumerili TaxID=41447 RepID=A0A3B4TA87_SERDU|nr:C-C chemokine receptor type 3-like [Seriola dumerili]
METTTFDYDYNSSVVQVPPCDPNDVNKLGAHLSVPYYFMFLFSVFGNGLVLVIIHRFEKLSTVTNILLLNLVLSSLIFMSSLPFMAAYMQLSNWIFGSVMCKLMGSVYYLGLYSSVLFLTLLTFDRHLAVVYSLDALRVRNRCYAVCSCAVVWLVSSLACIKPMMLLNTYTDNINERTICEENTGLNNDVLIKSGLYLQLFLFFIFPLVAIIYCYVRIGLTVISSRIVSKFKTVRLIFIIVLLFFLCWTPYNIVLLTRGTTCQQKRKRGYALHVTRNLAYIYFCISPIFYTFVGKKFQSYFRQMLVKHFPRLQKHISVDRNSKYNISTKSTPNEF